MKNIAEGIYRRVSKSGGGGFYERVQIDGKDTYRKLAATRLTEARALRAQHLAQYDQWRRGVVDVKNPYEASPDIPRCIYQIIQSYLAAGAPGRSRRVRSPRTLAGIKQTLDILAKWPGWKQQPIERIDVRVLENYHAWRRQHSVRIANGRTIDLELAHLNAALRWAVWQRIIPRNPIPGLERPSFKNGPTVNCRDCRPKDAKELNAIGRKLFGNVRSEVLGWQFFFEAFTGVRTGEALLCRWDAKPGQAGFIDGNCLHLARLKHGIKPYATIHPALKKLLEAMKQWRDERYPESPWYFPSLRDSAQPVDTNSLSHALRAIARKLTPGERRTSHGLRAYYVTARRSQGVDDHIIAAEIGDKTGAAIIASTYGGLPPNWMDTSIGKIDWLPLDEEPAWALLQQQAVQETECVEKQQGIEQGILDSHQNHEMSNSLQKWCTHQELNLKPADP
jgi:integrase